MQLPHNKKGFTLIELLLVIALISLLTGFIVPEMLKFNRRQQLRSATVEVLDELKRTHNLASNGVQTDTDFIAKYRFQFTKSVGGGDPDDYDGYRIVPLDSSDVEIAPDVKSDGLTCPVCANSSVQNVEYNVPVGSTSSLSGTVETIQICYPGVGQHTITVEENGRIYSSDFSDTGCTCSINSC